MSENHYIRTRMVTERRLEEAMDKLDKHHPQIAGRLRTIWRREDDAWARGEELPAPEPVEDDASPEADPKLYYDAGTEKYYGRAEWDAIRNGDVFRTAAQERVKQPPEPVYDEGYAEPGVQDPEPASLRLTMWERLRGRWHRF